MAMIQEDAKNTARTLLILCNKRHIQTIVQEFDDWNHQEGLEVTIVRYGITPKAHDGFVLLTFNKPLPEGVYANLAVDDDILDYVLYPPHDPIVPVPV